MEERAEELSYDTVGNVLSADASAIKDTDTNLSFAEDRHKAGLSASIPDTTYEYSFRVPGENATGDERIYMDLSKENQNEPLHRLQGGDSSP